MKDPLQTEQTPYELLGVGKDAGNADIDQAFRNGLVKRLNVQRLTAARRALQTPAERAMLDLFHYDPRVLSGLTPNPLDDHSVLEPPRRAATAIAWESRFRAVFPDLGLAHSLAVLWYWWAIYQEAHPQATTPPETLPADQLWQRVIAYWAMLWASKEFWEGQAGTPADLSGELNTRLVEGFRNKFHDLVQRARSHGEAEVAARYEGLVLALSTEIRTAKHVGSNGIRTSRGKIACGPLMLQQVGLFETVRAQVEVALKKSPSSAGLRSLREALSPYSSIAILIDSKKLQEAVRRIEALPANERNSLEVSQLLARALYELGKQQASVGQFNEALESWGSGLRCKQESIDVAIKSELVSTCQTQAAKLQRQPDDAIALLEKALALVEGDTLKLTLAEILKTRGIETINKAQKAGQTGMTRELIAEMERGLADLERAATLGSKGAAEQAAIARSILEQAKSGFLDLPQKARDLLGKASEAAARSDWDAAINYQQEALKAAGSKAPEAIKQNLAILLNNRAMALADWAVEDWNSAVKAQEETLNRWTAKLSISYNTTRCGHCNNWIGERWFTFNLPTGGMAALCATCADTLQSMLSNAPKPSAYAVSRLHSALADLSEAAKLDPSSDLIRTNLAHVQDVLSKLGPAAPFQLPSTAAPSTLPSSPYRKSTPSKRSDVLGGLLVWLFIVWLFAGAPSPAQFFEEATQFYAFIFEEVTQWLSEVTQEKETKTTIDNSQTVKTPVVIEQPIESSTERDDVPEIP